MSFIKQVSKHSKKFGRAVSRGAKSVARGAVSLVTSNESNMLPSLQQTMSRHERLRLEHILLHGCNEECSAALELESKRQFVESYYNDSTERSALPFGTIPEIRKKILKALSRNHFAKTDASVFTVLMYEVLEPGEVAMIDAWGVIDGAQTDAWLLGILIEGEARFAFSEVIGEKKPAPVKAPAKRAPRKRKAKSVTTAVAEPVAEPVVAVEPVEAVATPPLETSREEFKNLVRETMEASRNDHANMRWAEVAWRMQRGERVPSRWVGYLGGEMFAFVDWEAYKGFHVSVALSADSAGEPVRTYVGAFHDPFIAKEEAMLAVTSGLAQSPEDSVAVPEGVKATVEDVSSTVEKFNQKYGRSKQSNT